MTDSQPSWIGRQIGGRYQINQLLGRGGMSSVYQALDPNLQRTVAIKLIHPHLSEHPEFVKRFEQEAAAVAQLRHPNIIQVHDFNHQGDVYYMVLEYVRGLTLDAQLETLKQFNQRLTLDETVQIMTKLCDAVAYAHQRNMIHRDLKPSNVIITPEGEPILMDFGIAKIVGSDHVNTATGATMGTAAYMSPEQVKGDEIDRRADIYSLGVILYEMLSGQPPYEGRSALTVMMKHINEPIPDIRILNMEVPDMIVGILEKALAKEPTDRFNTAAEMATALRAISQRTTYQTVQKTVATPTATTPNATVVTNNVESDEDGEKTAVSRSRLPLIIGGLLLLGVIIAGALLYPRFVPTVASSANMVQIPAGSYTVGSENGGNQTAPAQDVTLAAFWLDQYEVTNGEYATFVNQRNATSPLSWSNAQPPAGRDAYPVQGVSWSMANSYCEWAGKRLPTEAEWEVAARGDSGLLYPWGDNAQLVTLPSNDTYPAGSIGANRSVYNVYDLSGNVWEWVDAPYTAVSPNEQLLRGGSFDNRRDLTYRLAGDPDLPTMQVSAGFRCAADEVEIVPDEDVIVEDEFSDPQSGWDSWDDGSVLYGYHPPDYYHVQASNTDTLSTAYFGGTFENITMESVVFVDAADTENGTFRYGLMLRRSGDSFYAFTISPRSGEWAVLKNSADGLAVLDEGEIEGLEGLAGDDTLRVDANGDNFAFSINGRLVSQFSDSDLPSGDIGFLVQTFDETRAHIHFDRLTVSDVAYEPPPMQ